MQLFRPDYGKVHDPSRASIFLAGPIQGAPHWNDWFIGQLHDLDIDIFDPRRDSMDGFVYDEQVAWETEHLLAAGIISFSFIAPIEDVPGRSYAQTSRFELGECLARAKYRTGQKVIVFAEKRNLRDDDGNFPGANYFKYKIENEYPDVAEFYDDAYEYIQRLRSACAECIELKRT